MRPTHLITLASATFSVDEGADVTQANDLFDFQRLTFDTLRQGQSVILQAPTGAGKTRAALYPFLYHLAEPDPAAFPRRCVYSVPMRVLVNQFGAEYDEVVSRYNLRYGLNLRRGVTVQTGERPEDRQFEGDLIFTTIDQTLSNVLGVPYATGRSRANLNAGAVIGSYLVFDEFHLFPPDGALKTTLQVLRLLGGVTPFVLMTATFSATMVTELEGLLRARAITVPPDELAHIPSQQGKARRFHVVEEEMSAGAILDRHAHRSIAIRNTVDRAQDLYTELVERGCRPLPVNDLRLDDFYTAIGSAWKPADRERVLGKALERLYELVREQQGWEHVTWVVLLHARFTREHRDLKEEFVRREFGSPEKHSPQVPRLILVATQVVEVGLDITCETMHTEVAPAASVLQRAGRCARFASEQGDVYVYDVPPGKDSKPNYAPYTGKGEAKLCQGTWDALRKLDEGDGVVLDFYSEQQLVNTVHAEADRQLLADMQTEERQIWEDITQGIALGDTAVRSKLIRRVDSRTLLVHDDPQQLGNPFACRGFSLWQGTLRGKFEELWDQADELDLEWALRRPVESEGEEDSRAPLRFDWPVVASEDQLSWSTLFVVHPALVAYDADLGFRFTESDGSYRTPPAPQGEKGGEDNYTYQLESYAEHVRGMLAVYRRELADPMAYVAARLETRLGLPAGSVDQAIRLAIALHDVGKLQVRWQKWARAYQQEIGEPLADAAFMAVHTHSETEAHRETARRVRPKRPHHAGEGAVAVARLVNRVVGGNHGLRRAVLTAIARHHTPQLDRFDEKYRLDSHASAAVAAALRTAGFVEAEGLAAELLLAAPATSLERQMLQLPPESDWDWWLLYFLIVRALRLADGKSQRT